MSESTQYLIQAILVRLTLGPVIAAAVIGLLRFRRLQPAMRYLAVLTWFELPIEIGFLIIMFWHGNNLFLMPIYAVGEFALLALVYRYTLESIPFTKVMPWLVGGFTAYALLDSLLAPTLMWFRPGQQVVQSVLVLGLVGLYFRKLLNELQVQRLSREPMFWVSAGLSLYYLGYLQIALFSNYLLRHYSAQLNANIWAVQSFLHIVLHSCYCLALWMRPQR